MKTLAEILLIENDPELLGICCPDTGVPLWSLIRVPLLRKVISDLVYKSGSYNAELRKCNVLQMGETLFRSTWHNYATTNRNASNICIHTTGHGAAHNRQIDKDRLIGHFFGSYKSSTMVMQDAPNWQWNDCQGSDRVLFTAPQLAQFRIRGQLKQRWKHKETARQVIMQAAVRAKKIIGYEFEQSCLQTLVSFLARQIALLPYACDYFAEKFNFYGFKLLMKEDACLGGSAVPIIHAARMNRMVVAEFQHGTVSAGHDGYNVAEALRDDQKYKATLPDLMLTYSDWWSSQINMPIRRITIGNPYMSEFHNQLEPASGNADKILILGDGVSTHDYLMLAKAIAEMIKGTDRQVVFRPHPFERANVDASSMPDMVTLDESANLVAALLTADMVVSELSTGLFEAVGVVENIVMWETEKTKFFYPELPFPSFRTLEQLEPLILANDIMQKLTAEDLWAPNWQLNYRKFVDNIVCG